MGALILLLAAACIGGAIVAAVLTRKHKKQLKQQSDYWQTYWYDHFDEIRQTGLTREQMERMHRLYNKSNDM